MHFDNSATEIRYKSIPIEIFTDIKLIVNSEIERFGIKKPLWIKDNIMGYHINIKIGNDIS